MRKAPILNAATANRIEAPTNHHRGAGSPIIPASRSKSKEEIDIMNKTENMAAMLLALTQSDEWFRLCDSDEGIREANDSLQALIDKLAADNPDEMMESCGRPSAVSVTLAVPLPCSTASGLPIPSASIRDVSAQSLSLTMQALRQSRIKAGT